MIVNFLYKQTKEFLKGNDKEKLNAVKKKFNEELKKYKEKSKLFYEKFASSKNNFNPLFLLQSGQDFIEKKVKGRPSEVFLRQSNFWAQSITWTLMGGTTFAILWLAIAKTEEIVQVRGKLEPIGGVIDIQMPLQGIAQKIHIEEGQKVVKGDVLVTLDTEVNKAKNKSIEKNLQINKSILKRLKLLVAEGAVSEIQYLQQETKISELESLLKENEVTLRYQRIQSPITGMVFDLKPTQPGFVARTSEPIMKIVPVDKLKASVEIDSRSIGFVSVGKKVDISIDSFPARDFGVITGEISYIASDALPPERMKDYRFPAKIELNKQDLLLKNGTTIPLQTGMSLTANIKLRKVSYLQLLLNTFQDKADSLRSL